MDKCLSERIGLYFESLPPPTGRTFHQMQPETLLSECQTTIDLQGSVIIGYQNRVAELEKALRKICDGPRDADKSYAELFAEVCWEARAALAGEKKDEQRS